MLNKISNKNMGKSDLGWLQSSFHFSFAEYFNFDNMNFGSLRVLNDDIIHPHTGFQLHPHNDMEIITYIVNGTLTHKDSMGNERTLTRGEVQYMSAGTGIFHSEMNNHDDTLRLLQIWILPDKKNHTPNYGEYKFKLEDREGKWLHMVSSKNGNAKIKINQDVNISAIITDENSSTNFKVSKGRQAYLVQIEGTSTINGITLNEKDALEIVEEDISILSNSKSHFIILEMKKAILD